MADEENEKQEDLKAQETDDSEAQGTDDSKAKETDDAKAKETDDAKAKKTDDAKAKKTDAKTSGSRLLQWIIMAIVVIICASAGLGLSRLLAGSGTTKTDEVAQQDPSAQAETPKTNVPDLTGDGTQKNWYYDLEPVVANLNEPGVTRYVRASLTLEISAEVDARKGIPFLDEKRPVLTNWLTIYLASLTLEDIRGDRKLRSIQSQILDAFNEKVFPDAKPQIKHILFKEFAIQ